MKNRNGCWIAALAVGLLLVMCLAAAGISALRNRSVVTRPTTPGLLSQLDKTRLAEALHLKRTLGDAVWPGFAQADIPVLLWEDDYSFLFGHPAPPQDWEMVPDDDFDGQPFYRHPGDDHQNFAVQVGDRWVSSMATKSETDTFLIEQIQDALPPIVRDVLPYQLLIQPSEVQISAVLHEAFHVIQAEQAPERLAAAEASYDHEEAYWAADRAMREDWQAEIALLAEVVRADAAEDVADLARQFLARRQERREKHKLMPDLVDFERQLEWEEGLAKYVELAIWRLAASSSGYAPLPEMVADSDFDGYRGFSQRLAQELDQMKRQAGMDGVTRFYYTGMAQGVLLDRLMPGWKAQALNDDIFLEDLLQTAADED